jgi:hypothetical protein
VPATETSYLQYWPQTNVSEFISDLDVGIKPSAWLFVPPPCGTSSCKLLILPGGCEAFTDGTPGGQDDVLASMLS